MLEYSEYKSLLEILKEDKDSIEDDRYTKLMAKEEKVLDTTNNVIKLYRDKQYKKKDFLHSSLYEIYHSLFLELPLLASDMGSVRNLEGFLKVLNKNNRLVYIGVILVILSFIMYFILY